MKFFYIQGFNILFLVIVYNSQPFRHSRNQEVLQKLVADAKVHLPDTTSAMIRGIEVLDHGIF